MPKISELNAITSVANNDLLMVVHDPSGLPSTNKITVNNFISSVGSQLRGYTGSAGTGGGTGTLPDNALDGQILFSNGSSNSWKFNPDIKAIGAIYDRTSYTATEYDAVILVVPATQGQAITITLPGTVPVGKIYTIRNIDSNGGQYPVIVNTSGVAGLIEHPHLGTVVESYSIQYTGDTESWIFDGNYYRNISPLSNSPVFLTSANSFHQVVLKNVSNANNASSDWVAYNDLGDYLAGTGPFVDMGINSSEYSSTEYGNVWKQNDSYLYNDGGNLIIGPDSDHTIKFVAGGTNEEDIQFTINSSSVGVKGQLVIGGLDSNQESHLVVDAANYWTSIQWKNFTSPQDPNAAPFECQAQLLRVFSGNNSIDGHEELVAISAVRPSETTLNGLMITTSDGKIPDAPYNDGIGTQRNFIFGGDGILHLDPSVGNIYRNGVSVLGTGQIDGGNAFTTPTAEITVDGGGA